MFGVYEVNLLTKKSQLVAKRTTPRQAGDAAIERFFKNRQRYARHVVLSIGPVVDEDSAEADKLAAEVCS